MKKVCTYYYDLGVVLDIFVKDEKFYIRDGDGKVPFCPIRKNRSTHPSDNGYDLPHYIDLGLYYGYGMGDSGWG